MADDFASPMPAASHDLGSCRISDESARAKWRTWSDQWSVPIGKARQIGDGLVLSVAPGEWIAVDAGAPPADAVDITHVRAMLRFTGPGARSVLAHVCALDLGDQMTPNGAAARTLVADVATELVRDDVGDEPSYLLLVSRSFARHTWDRLAAVASR